MVPAVALPATACAAPQKTQQLQRWPSRCDDMTTRPRRGHKHDHCAMRWDSWEGSCRAVTAAVNPTVFHDDRLRARSALLRAASRHRRHVLANWQSESPVPTTTPWATNCTHSGCIINKCCNANILRYRYNGRARHQHGVGAAGGESQWRYRYRYRYRFRGNGSGK